MTAQPKGPADPNAERARWMAVLARATRHELEAAWQGLGARPPYAFLRQPEIGLVMVRGRAGGTGSPFNFGEMTVTRCTVRLEDGRVGHCYAAGRDKRKAELAALFDALMQGGEAARLQETVIAPIARRVAEQRRRVSRKAAATKVDFFTLVRGDNPQ
ncbi:phosphonate C-P lyase system protein PhnG [Chelativorans intermedius]|uniref:Phosphonate C-P lyase system protein PhnG n=1 Tax=Chelativorans intermedius TaxID=515947 RepID=A0ABV6D5K6_9HYPH|nr:phosphonate C-P lyase system protein PhnG [Chelativorans intermedius]MCT8998836.1 phosphonate C-P lyase system protein PhnG [Chelativorans intermedius]